MAGSINSFEISSLELEGGIVKKKPYRFSYKSQPPYIHSPGPLWRHWHPHCPTGQTLRTPIVFRIGEPQKYCNSCPSISKPLSFLVLVGLQVLASLSEES